ncbi:MAG: HD domain-containing protein [Nevskia sp.]|nr:HD domain-containing protein [Nevskia sp.]
MAMVIGGTEWEAQYGRLSSADRWRYVLEGVRTRLRVVAASLLQSGRKPRELHRVDLDRIVHPDSTFARTAVERLEGWSSPALAHHSRRSYIWASLLGQLDGRQWDPELLFVAAMLHDLGLTERGHGCCSQAQCFTLDAVHASADVLAATTPERAERIRRAILLHLNIRVPGERFGWEAHYLQAGTSLDVIGQRYRQLPQQAVQPTLQRYPRLGLKQELGGWIRRESSLRPHSRMAMLDRLGFSGMVRAAPFDS